MPELFFRPSSRWSCGTRIASTQRPSASYRGMKQNKEYRGYRIVLPELRTKVLDKATEFDEYHQTNFGPTQWAAGDPDDLPDSNRCPPHRSVADTRRNYSRCPKPSTASSRRINNARRRHLSAHGGDSRPTNQRRRIRVHHVHLICAQPSPNYPLASEAFVL